MNAVLAREFRTDVIATLDHCHFRVIRPLTPHTAPRGQEVNETTGQIADLHGVLAQWQSSGL
jgi:hypothetical protein